MADVLIRGMEMPKHCIDCPLMVDRFDTDACALQSKEANEEFESWDDMRRGCPLLPLPEGHGRLIDGDALFEKMYRLSDNEGAHKDSRVDDALILRDSACYLIEDAPTIVPAEGGNADGN